MKKQDAKRQVALQQVSRARRPPRTASSRWPRASSSTSSTKGRTGSSRSSWSSGTTSTRNPIFQGPPPDGSTTDVTGPLHNQIPQPDRSVDNTTLWQSDYNQTHYEDMYFNRMAEYYETQSSRAATPSRARSPTG